MVAVLSLNALTIFVLHRRRTLPPTQTTLLMDLSWMTRLAPLKFYTFFCAAIDMWHWSVQLYRFLLFSYPSIPFLFLFHRCLTLCGPRIRKKGLRLIRVDEFAYVSFAISSCHQDRTTDSYPGMFRLLLTVIVAVSYADHGPFNQGTFIV
jgi:hypothetical protein